VIERTLDSIVAAHAVVTCATRKAAGRQGDPNAQSKLHSSSERSTRLTCTKPGRPQAAMNSFNRTRACVRYCSRSGWAAINALRIQFDSPHCRVYQLAPARLARRALRARTASRSLCSRLNSSSCVPRGCRVLGVYHRSFTLTTPARAAGERRLFERAQETAVSCRSSVSLPRRTRFQSRRTCRPRASSVLCLFYQDRGRASRRAVSRRAAGSGNLHSRATRRCQLLTPLSPPPARPGSMRKVSFVTAKVE